MTTTLDRRDVRSTCAASLNKSKTLVFIDANVDESEYLAAGIYNNNRVYVLEGDRDGIDQITAIVQKQSDKIDAIHIVSHGSPGCLYLGNAVLSHNNLGQHQEQLLGWKNVLSQTASILLYGCCVAYGRGAEFVKELSNLTAHAIAAAVDYTGNAALGGSWNLDYTTGPIAADPVLKPETMAGYGGLLATVIVTNINDAGPGSLREAIALAADGKVTGVGFDGAGAGVRTASGTTLTIEKAIFENNYANGEGGGAIFAGFRSNNTVINSHFEDNTSLANHSATEKSERGGGEIAVKSESATTVTGSTFINNNGISGGAINTLLGELTVSDSTFIGNDTTEGGLNAVGQQGMGGAIFTDGASAADDGSTSGTIHISNSHFEGNIAAGQGGALRPYGYARDKTGDRVIVENSTIINNKVIQNSQGASLGGGMLHGEAALEIRNTTFANNVAEGGQGGGLFVSKNTVETNSRFKIISEQGKKQFPAGGLFLPRCTTDYNFIL